MRKSFFVGVSEGETSWQGERITAEAPWKHYAALQSTIPSGGISCFPFKSFHDSRKWIKDEKLLQAH